MIPGITASQPVAGGGGGGDPSIRSQQTHTSSSAATRTIDMPASVVPGDMLVVCLAFQSAISVSIDTGFSGSDWSVEEDSAGTNCKVWVAKKIATGSDALRINTGTGSCLGASFAIANGGVIQSASQSFAAPGTDTANAPAVTGLTDGVVAVCFVVFSGNGEVTTASAPSGYSLVTQGSSGQLFDDTKTISGTSEDPATYAPGGNTAHVMATVVVTAA